MSDIYDLPEAKFKQLEAFLVAADMLEVEWRAGHLPMDSLARECTAYASPRELIAGFLIAAGNAMLDYARGTGDANGR